MRVCQNWTCRLLPRASANQPEYRSSPNFPYLAKLWKVSPALDVRVTLLFQGLRNMMALDHVLQVGDFLGEVCI